MKTNKSQQNIPEGWQARKLASVFEFKNGLNKEKKFFGHGTPIVNYTDVYNGGGLRANNVLGRVEVNKSELERFNVRRGDVFFTRTSETLDEIGFSAVALDDFEDAVFSGFVLRARQKEKLLAPEYAQYCFKTQSTPKEIIEKSSYTTRALTSGTSLNHVNIVLPPISEQKRIVSVLETWDKSIDKLSKKIDTRKRIERGLMKRLLTGEVRLSGFSEKWKDVSIGEFSIVVALLNTQDKKYEVLSCTKYDGLVRSLEYFDRQVYGNDLTKYKIVPNSHFAYATNHIEEGSIGLQDLMDFGLVSPMYTVFKTKGVNNKFLYKLLKTPRLIFEYQRHMTASVERRGGLRWGAFSKIKVTIPSLEEQNAIATFIETAEKEIEQLEQKLKLLKDQRNYLLNNLITGTIRTPEKLSTHN